MPRFETLIFDLDDTLLDFQATQWKALKEIFTFYHVPYTPQTIERYNNVNLDLWRQLELDQIDRETVLNTRFSLTFEQLGVSVDGTAAENAYRKQLNQGTDVIQGASELLESLYPTHRIYAGTNGSRTTQYQRLANTRMDHYFSYLFISEEMGFHKPDRLFFTTMFASIPGFDPETTLMIGDNPLADIEGAKNAGIQACWFNPKHLSHQRLVYADYEIDTLSQLAAIVM